MRWLTFSSRIRRPVFYLYKLPHVWRKFFVFGKLAPGWCVGLPKVREVQVCVNVVPMGWLLAVAAMRRLYLAVAPAGAAMKIPELTGCDAFPLEHSNCLRTSHQTFLDNWDQVKVAKAEEALNDLHRASLQQLQLRQAFEQHGVMRSPSKTVEGELLMTSLGVDWDGKTGTVGPDGERLCKLVVALLLAAAAEEPSLLLLQEVVGLACFCFTYQRALYACFSGVFHWMSAPKPGPLPDEVVDELLSAATVCFSCVCHLRNEVQRPTLAFKVVSAMAGQKKNDSHTKMI